MNLQINILLSYDNKFSSDDLTDLVADLSQVVADYGFENDEEDEGSFAKSLVVVKPNTPLEEDAEVEKWLEGVVEGAIMIAIPLGEQ